MKRINLYIYIYIYNQYQKRHSLKLIYKGDKEKRGAACIKQVHDARKDGKEIPLKWIIDKDIPIFKGEGREYIDRLIMVGN